MKKEPEIRESHYLDIDGTRRKYVNRYENGNLVEQYMYTIEDEVDTPVQHVLQTWNADRCESIIEERYVEGHWILIRRTDSEWDGLICTELISERNDEGELVPMTKKVHTYLDEECVLSTLTCSNDDGEWKPTARQTCDYDDEKRMTEYREEYWIGAMENDPGLWELRAKTEYTYGENPAIIEYETDYEQLLPVSKQVEQGEGRKKIFTFYGFSDGEWVPENIGTAEYADDACELIQHYLVVRVEDQEPTYKQDSQYDGDLLLETVDYVYEDGEWHVQGWNKLYY